MAPVMDPLVDGQAAEREGAAVGALIDRRLAGRAFPDLFDAEGTKARNLLRKTTPSGRGSAGCV